MIVVASPVAGSIGAEGRKSLQNPSVSISRAEMLEKAWYRLGWRSFRVVRDNGGAVALGAALAAGGAAAVDMVGD